MGTTSPGIDGVKSRRRLQLVGDVPAPSHDDLLVRVGRGDREAFAMLYDQIAPVVYGLARRVVRDAQIAEDIAQETLVEIWRQAPQFDPSKGRAMSWVAVIAHRRAVDRVRSEQSHRNRNLLVAAEQRRSTNGDEISAAIVREDTRTEVADSLACLTDVQREAIQLAFYDGRTYSEVAELLDIPVGTAKTRIRDGLIKLRDAASSIGGAP
jgi:RNA polymerase sigma-70 factor, ECF subfamily